MIEENIQRMNVQDAKAEKDVWKYEHAFDYHYGRTIGIITRVLRAEFEKKYHKTAKPDEVIETMAIVNLHSWKIRQALAIFKTE